MLSGRKLLEFEGVEGGCWGRDYGVYDGFFEECCWVGLGSCGGWGWV